MANKFKLDNIREEARKKYGPVEIEIDENTSITLTAVLRLGEKDRKKVVAALDDLKGFDADDETDLSEEEAELVADSVLEVFRSVAREKDVRKLEAALADEEMLVKLDILTEILNIWIARTQPGEA